MVCQQKKDGQNWIMSLTFSLPLRLISALRAAAEVFFFTCTAAAGAGAAATDVVVGGDDTDFDLPAK